MALQNFIIEMSSIAISAVVRPSRILLLATVAMCVCTITFGALIGMGLIGSFSLHGRLIIACFSIGSSLFAFFCHLRSRKSLRIDISGIGQIRLVEHTEAVQVFNEQQVVSQYDEEEFLLRDGSILWPNLLFLHLKSTNGRVEKLRILSDSVSHDEFRALHVACRWLVARHNMETDKAF